MASSLLNRSLHNYWQALQTHEQHMKSIKATFKHYLCLLYLLHCQKKHYIDNDKHSKHLGTPKPIKLLSDYYYLLVATQIFA